MANRDPKTETQEQRKEDLLTDEELNQTAGAAWRWRGDRWEWSGSGSYYYPEDYYYGDRYYNYYD
jgi:hypothetical protein